MIKILRLIALSLAPGFAPGASATFRSRRPRWAERRHDCVADAGGISLGPNA
jgi:hypothetical protein